MFVELLGNIYKHHILGQTAGGTFWATFGENWASFSSNIGQHCMLKSLIRTPWKIFYLTAALGTSLGVKRIAHSPRPPPTRHRHLHRLKHLYYFLSYVTCSADDTSRRHSSFVCALVSARLVYILELERKNNSSVWNFKPESENGR